MGVESSGRKQYGPECPRLPIFFNRFRAITDEMGGVTKVAEITGISRPTIQFWYNGQRTPDAENLGIISLKLGVTVDYLLGISEAQSRDEDVQIAQMTTGLSEEAISRIKHWKSVIRTEADSPLPSILNRLIENDAFMALLITLSNFERSISYANEICDKAENSTYHYKSEWRVLKEQLEDAYKEMRLYRFDSSEGFNSAVSSIFDYTVANDRCRIASINIMQKMFLEAEDDSGEVE